jgi:hypothetical protein
VSRRDYSCPAVPGPALMPMSTANLPTREWVEESGAWMQYVAKEPATRMDVIRLQVCERPVVG